MFSFLEESPLTPSFSFNFSRHEDYFASSVIGVLVATREICWFWFVSASRPPNRKLGLLDEFKLSTS
jgi:hypothetical protein